MTYSKNVSTFRCCIVFQFVQITAWFNWKQQETSERHLIWCETMVANNGKSVIFPEWKILACQLAKSSVLPLKLIKTLILRLNATFMQRKEFSFLPKNVQYFSDWSDRFTVILIFWWTTNLKLQILSRENSLSELTCCANKNAFALNLACLNEGIASWLCCFSRWGVGPF